MPQKFIHAADIHLDSPIAGLRGVDAAFAENLQKATRHSFQRIVDLAIHHQVAAVVISGDLFDRPVEDAGTALWRIPSFGEPATRAFPSF